jgi:ribosome-binding factor A
MASRRTQRVSEQLHQELSSLLLRAKDLRLNLVTLTGVDVSPDLQLCRVHFITAEGRLSTDDALAALARAVPFLRRELAQRLRLRVVPALTFSLDKSIEQGRRIEALLASLQPPAAPPEPEPD